MKSIMYCLIAVALVSTVSAAYARDDHEEKISLSDVPQKVLEAAQKALPGFKLQEAETEQSGEKLIYDLEGEVAGEEYELEVSPDGKILEVEKEDEDSSDDDSDSSDDSSDSSDSDDDSDSSDEDEDKD